MTTVTVKVTTKKGQEQDTTWSVTRFHPRPTTGGHTGRIDWVNDEGALGRYNEPPALKEEYAVALLRSDYGVAMGHAGNRNDFAGYEGAPGAIVLRGVSLGETSARVSPACGRLYWDWKVRGFERPTATERALLDVHVAPAIMAYIEANRAEFRAAALQALRERFASELEGARARLAELETQAAKAMAELESSTK